MTKRTIKGWVPKDESNEETIELTIKYEKGEGLPFPIKAKATEGTELKQVILTLICEDVKEKKE